MHYFSKLRNYFFIYFIIALSGILLTMRENIFLIVYFACVIFLSVISKLSNKIFKKFIILLSIAVFINILQFIYFDVFLINSLFSLIIVFTVGYLINEILKETYIPLYIKLTFFFSLISLFFYFLGLIYPASFSFLGNMANALNIDPHYTSNFLFYNFYDAQANLFGVKVLRNSGFLYEPGMFACILIPALAFNTIIKRKLFNKYNSVFILAILTTFSTAAYLAIVVFFIIYTIIFKGFSLNRSIIVVSVVVVSAGSFWQLDFIGGKIKDQYELAIYGPDSQRHLGRIGSALVDLDEIKTYPLIGRGRHFETRFDQHDLLNVPNFTHRVNGIFVLMAAMGVPFFILYLFFLFKSINNAFAFLSNNKYSWIIFLIPFLIMASSQTILLRPFFLSLLFLYPLGYNTEK